MTQDAGALLKLADELKWRSNDLDYDAVDQKIFASTEKFIRQAASQGSAVGERSEVQINYALRGEIADAIREYCHSVSPAAVQNSHGVERIYYSGISLDGLTDAVFAILHPAQAVLAPSDCDWPDEPFTFRDDPGEHDPCYVVMPGGGMLPLNHHAAPGVDIARAKFIVDACNMALSPDFPRAAVAEAMQDAWNTICADTDCHPLDIEHRGKELFFKPGHWADLIALFLSRSPSIPPAHRGASDEHV